MLCPLWGVESQVVSEDGDTVWVSECCKLLTSSHSCDPSVREGRELGGPLVAAPRPRSLALSQDRRAGGASGRGLGASSPSLGSPRNPVPCERAAAVCTRLSGPTAGGVRPQHQGSWGEQLSARGCGSTFLHLDCELTAKAHVAAYVDSCS